LPAGSYERQLFLTAATEVQDWSAIVAVTEPPTTIEELIQRVEAFNRLGDSASAINALDHFSRQLQLPESMEVELRRRVNVQEAIRR